MHSRSIKQCHEIGQEVERLLEERNPFEGVLLPERKIALYLYLLVDGVDDPVRNQAFVRFAGSIRDEIRWHSRYRLPLKVNRDKGMPGEIGRLDRSMRSIGLGEELRKLETAYLNGATWKIVKTWYQCSPECKELVIDCMEALSEREPSFPKSSPWRTFDQPMALLIPTRKAALPAIASAQTYLRAHRAGRPPETALDQVVRIAIEAFRYATSTPELETCNDTADPLLPWAYRKEPSVSGRPHGPLYEFVQYVSDLYPFQLVTPDSARRIEKALNF